MRRRGCCLVALLLLSANTNPAERPAIVREYFSQFSNPGDRANLRQLAFCVADRYPAQARMAVRDQATTMMLRKKYPDLLDFSCLKPAFFRTKYATVKDGLYQQFFAERLLVKSFSSASLPDISQVAPLNHPYLPEIEREKIPEQFLPEFELSWALHGVDVAAECVTRASPMAAFALMQTTPDSDQESTAIRNMRESIGKCFHDGQADDIPPYIWRGMLSENLYRLADAAGSADHDVSKPHA